MDRKFEIMKADSHGKARTKATDLQWYLVDTAIKAFISKYPLHWIEFQRQLKAERTKYQLATVENKELRKRSWRNTASFPTIEDADGNTIDALLPVLQKFIPNLTRKNSINYQEFLRRYPIFLPGEKF